MKAYRGVFEIPIYGGIVILSVSDDIWKARARENDLLGVYPPESHEGQELCRGLHCSYGMTFGIFFLHNCVRHGALAHEIFHMTHRILQFVEVTFTKANHEPFTYLCQYLTDEVYGHLNQAKIPVIL